MGYFEMCGVVLQVPTGGHAVNLDHWFPVQLLDKQYCTFL